MYKSDRDVAIAPADHPRTPSRNFTRFPYLRRARVEYVFGAQSNDMGGTLVRSIGLVRARARIGLKNLAYNMRRLVQLERLAAAAPT